MGAGRLVLDQGEKLLKLVDHEDQLDLQDPRFADAVADIARRTGVTLERVVGLGDSRPIARNDSPANMQKNRRTEIYIKPGEDAETADSDL